MMVRAIVAACNSALTVGDTVGALRDLPAVCEVLVVDDGSADATAEVARAAGAWVLRLPENRGKGDAVAAGVAAMPGTDVYLLVDADLGATAAGCGALLGPVVAGDADMTVGVLPAAGSRGGFGLVRDATRAGIERACGLRAQAPLSGQRAVRGELMRSLEPASRFGLEAGMTIDAVRAGARVIEVPIEVDHRHRGRSLGGFVHRARQGADIARALWPRLTSHATRVALTLVVTLVVLAAMLAVAGRRTSVGLPSSTPAPRVLVVGITGLDWDDLGTGAMPALDRLTSSGALGAMTVRTRSARPGVTEGYASLGAGSRVRALDVVASGPSAIAAGGLDTDGAALVDAAALREGAGRNAATLPGSMGDALHRAGRRTAVVGNADIPAGLVNVTVDGRPRPARFRPAAAALADGSGRVDVAHVGSELLRRDASAPFGIRADPDAVVAATKAALAAADVVLVDPGDLTRVAALGGDGVVEPYRARALADTDALLGRLTADLAPSTLVLVVSVVPRGSQWALTPVVAVGAGVRGGDLSTASTRRRGLVTLTDLAPTILGSLGVPVPAGFVGNALRYVPGTPDPTRLALLDAADTYREALHVPVVATFVVSQLALYVAVAWWVRRARRRAAVRHPPTGPVAGRRAGEALRLALLAVAAFPLATFLFRAAAFAIAWGAAGLTVLVGIDLALVAVTCLPGLHRRARARPLGALAWVLSATVVVIVVDVATGGRLQTASFMGYHPQVAGRFYGIGNTAFAILASSALLSAVVHVHHAPRRRDALVSVAAFLVVVVVADGAPSVGDDVGGIITLVPVFMLTMLALAGRRISARVMGAVAGATTAVLALATAADLARGPGRRTHLGRLAVSIAEDGLAPLVATMARKAEVSLGILAGSPWTWMAPVTALVLFDLLVRQGRGGGLLPPGSPRRVGVVAILAVGFLGALVNDSGVVVTALVLAYLGVFTATIALDSARRAGVGPVLLEPVGPPRPAPGAVP